MAERGFVLTPTADGGLDFDLRAAWSPKMRKAFVDSGADGLIANYARGFIGRDVEFVRDLQLRRLNVLARTIDDLSPIYDLADTIEEIDVQAGSRTRIDVGLLPRLRSLSCSWDQVAETIDQTSKLEHLFLASYDPHDLAPLAHLASLQSLRMKDHPAIRSLDGLEGMPWLTHLGIYLAPLEDTTALAQLASPVLTELHLHSCKRLQALDNLRQLAGLRLLDLGNCGAIESLHPIAGARWLESLYLYESTNIIDGDLSPVLGFKRLRDLRMMNRRHYRPSVNEVTKQLGLWQ